MYLPLILEIILKIMIGVYSILILKLAYDLIKLIFNKNNK